MKLTSTFLIPALCCVASTAASYVYTYDSHSQPSSNDGETSQLSPVAARMVLAQRTGVEDFHSADLYREKVIEAINKYGLRSSLFGGDDEELRRALYLVEAGDGDRVSGMLHHIRVVPTKY